MPRVFERKRSRRGTFAQTEKHKLARYMLRLYSYDRSQVPVHELLEVHPRRHSSDHGVEVFSCSDVELLPSCPTAAAQNSVLNASRLEHVVLHAPSSPPLTFFFGNLAPAFCGFKIANKCAVGLRRLKKT